MPDVKMLVRHERSRPLLPATRCPRLRRLIFKLLRVPSGLLDTHVMYDDGGICVLADATRVPNVKCAALHGWDKERVEHHLKRLEVVP